MNINDIFKIQNSNEKIIALHEFCMGLSPSDLKGAEMVVYSIENMENEVMNGGFRQYFLNSSGDTWKDCLESLKKVNATKSLDLFLKSLSIFKDHNPPIDWSARKIVVDQLSKAQIDLLDELDKEFYKYEDKLQDLVLAYAEEHKEDFSR
ncbi:DUF4375 domain-containing protein [Patescibacteria group bacterium]|nr:DUF4375 domain-containing protein [Patescibacteria group bacterium]MDE1946676.1 DMP19 family protein [Patescibacteria group bacterium]MDE2010629.1 DMP19 family protein [Patescibacteria group bacterium]MDE2233740.1 DMP19 family protein [Patescibacteria group bacterium]